jgi:pimeloyl-ACP methyl ester carboxylesterase
MSIRSLLLRASALSTFAVAACLAGCTATGTSTSSAGSGRTVDQVRVAQQVDIARQQRQAARRSGEVYLMRGLMDIFSRGIDVMAVQMRRQGLYAVDASYSDWKKLADDVIARDKKDEVSYPIVIIGHSLGANDATRMANYLGENGVKVAYVVAFDPTEPGYVGKNVGTVVNYYLPNDNNKVYKASGFRGSIANVDMSDNPDITHTTIEKNAKLQAKVISSVLKITKRRRG